MSSFDLKLNSNKLPHDNKWLSCRVDIDHDDSHRREHCGRRMRVAGMSFLQKHLAVNLM